MADYCAGVWGYKLYKKKQKLLKNVLYDFIWTCISLRLCLPYKVNDWPTQVRRIFDRIYGELDIYNDLQVWDISYARNTLFNNYAKTWHARVMSKPRLRIYR